MISSVVEACAFGAASRGTWLATSIALPLTVEQYAKNPDELSFLESIILPFQFEINFAESIDYRLSIIYSNIKALSNLAYSEKGMSLKEAGPRDVS